MRDGVLHERHIHTYPLVWSETKLHIILNRYKRYIKNRYVEAIIVKIPPTQKHTDAISLLIKRLERLAKANHCSFKLITKKEMRQALNLHSTKALNECARMLYPELSVYYEKGIYSDHKYYKKIFEAVLAAHIYFEAGKRKGFTTK